MPLRLRHQRQDLLDELRVEGAEQVGPVVGGHVLEERAEVLAVPRLHQFDLPVERIVGEDFRLPLYPGGLQRPPQFAVVEALGELGRGGRMKFRRHLAQACHVPLGEHRPQLRNQDRVGCGHGEGRGGQGEDRGRSATEGCLY